MSAPECQWCGKIAEFRVEAQWTILDWDWINVCSIHWHLGWAELAVRRVDGALPLELHTQNLIDSSTR